MMRSDDDDEDLLGFAPPDFFFSEEVDLYLAPREGGVQVLPAKYLLPSLGELMGEESYATVSVAWHYSGLTFHFDVTCVEPVSVAFPDIQQGDSIELFIDTRAQNLARTTHRFCHHFYLLPERFEGHEKGEITRFRTEDSHPLCSEELLELQVKKRAKGYVALFFIPKECLVGFDPQEGSRLGFMYRINRSGGQSCHFGLSSDYCRIEYASFLWPQLRLVGEKKSKK